MPHVKIPSAETAEPPARANRSPRRNVDWKPRRVWCGWLGRGFAAIGDRRKSRTKTRNKDDGGLSFSIFRRSPPQEAAAKPPRLRDHVSLRGVLFDRWYALLFAAPHSTERDYECRPSGVRTV